MKAILKRLVAIAFIFSTICAFPGFAANGTQQSIDRSIEPRGQYISSSQVSISHKGYGVIGISASTTAYEVVDKIRIHLYLDRLVGDNQWSQVDDFDFYFYPSDVPNGDLSMATLSFEVSDQPTGYYYRVRGAHGVWKDGVVETQSTRTDGVYISNDPFFLSE